MRPNRLLRVGIVIMLAGPALGGVGFVAGMLHSFATIQGDAVPTPASLARGAEWSIFAPIAGILVGMIGFALAAFAVWTRKREQSQAVPAE